MGLTSKSALAPSGELLAFDGDWWQVKIGRGYSADLTDWARENTIGCMWLLIPAHDQQAIHRAEDQGARVMDIRVELARDTAAQDATTRPAKAEDMDALATISRTAFRGLTRFYADPRFPDERCDDLYENWFRTGPWAETLVIIDDAWNPGGFVTIQVEGDEAIIGLIAVGERMRGQGWGTFLSKAAVDWAYRQGIPRIKVVTQGCNIRAQRAFQHAGFLTTKVDVWLHHWYA